MPILNSVAGQSLKSSLATTDHAMTAMEKWGDAHFSEQDAQTKAQQARDAYKEALRKAN